MSGAFEPTAFDNASFYVTSGPPVTPVGPAGAATLVMLLEPGTKVTYSWATSVLKAWSGKEQRIATLTAPRQAYDGKAIVNDNQLAPILSALVLNAATAQPFLLGLAYEALTLSQNGVGSTVYVPTTALADWIQPGQRVVVAAPTAANSTGPDSVTTIDSYIVSSTSNTIILNDDVHVAALAGGVIMPAQAVYFDPQQKFGRYVAHAGEWDISARAALFGFAGVPTMGVGATVNTYLSIPLWDRGIVNKGGTVSQPLDAGSEIVDLGGLIDNFSNWIVSDWGRQLAIESSYQADFQWLKAFLYAVRGQQVVFFAPTQRPDLTPIGDASSGTLKVVGGAAGASDYAGQWFGSLAQRYLQITLTSGTVAYRTVTAAVDNHDGTQSLTLDSALAGAIASVSFLETCRLASDEVDMTWNGFTFSCSLMARVAQQ